MQYDLLAVTSPYNGLPGWKESETSRDAALAVEASGKASNDRELLYKWFLAGNSGTADEAIAAVGLEPVFPRPRITELHKKGLIEKTGVRRKADGGRLSHEWRLA